MKKEKEETEKERHGARGREKVKGGKVSGWVGGREGRRKEARKRTNVDEGRRKKGNLSRHGWCF